METHLRAAGILNVALGIFGIVATVVILILFGGPQGVLLINGRIGSTITTTEGYVTAAAMIFMMVMAGPLIAVGLGLLRYQEWARNLGMILSIVCLVHIPIGTIIAGYTLWVLTSYEVEPLFTAPPKPMPQRKH